MTQADATASGANWRGAGTTCADSNGNGVLEFDEFEQVIKAHLGKGASANGLGACRSRCRTC